MFTQGDFDAATAAARQAIDATGYGGFVSDAKVSTFVDQVLKAIETHRQEAGRTGK